MSWFIMWFLGLFVARAAVSDRPFSSAWYRVVFWPFVAFLIFVLVLAYLCNFIEFPFAKQDHKGPRK